MYSHRRPPSQRNSELSSRSLCSGSELPLRRASCPLSVSSRPAQRDGAAPCDLRLRPGSAPSPWSCLLGRALSSACFSVELWVSLPAVRASTGCRHQFSIAARAAYRGLSAVRFIVLCSVEMVPPPEVQACARRWAWTLRLDSARTGRSAPSWGSARGLSTGVSRVQQPVLEEGWQIIQCLNAGLLLTEPRLSLPGT